jgi:hypothetical protein
MMRNTRKKQTPLSRLQSCIGYIKLVQEDSSMGHQELLPDSDTFTRLWYDATKPESGGLKPGPEQVLVTQLFLDVKTVMDRHDHLHHQHTQLMLTLLGDTETAKRLLNRKPPAVQLPTIPQEVSLVAYPHQSYPSMDIPKEAMLAMNTLCASNPVWLGLHMFYRLVGVKLEKMDEVRVQAAPVAVAHLQNALQHLHHVDAPYRPLLQPKAGKIWHSIRR